MTNGYPINGLWCTKLPTQPDSFVTSVVTKRKSQLEATALNSAPVRRPRRTRPSHYLCPRTSCRRAPGTGWRSTSGAVVSRLCPPRCKPRCIHSSSATLSNRRQLIKIVQNVKLIIQGVQGDSGGRMPWFGGLRFAEFPRLVGRYCSYLLPNTVYQPNQGTRPLDSTTRVTLYILYY